MDINFGMLGGRGFPRLEAMDRRDRLDAIAYWTVLGASDRKPSARAGRRKTTLADLRASSRYGVTVGALWDGYSTILEARSGKRAGKAPAMGDDGIEALGKVFAAAHAKVRASDG